MKVIARPLLTLPFVIVVVLYLRLSLAGNGCRGLVELLYSIVLWTLLVITFIVAVLGALRKRQSERLNIHRLSLAITLAALVTLIAGGLFGDTLNGAVWIAARSENYMSQAHGQDLILRKNGTFTIHLNEVDFSCYYTGSYKKRNDTLSFEDAVILKTNSKMASSYLINGGQLLPVMDTSKDHNLYTKFEISEAR